MPGPEILALGNKFIFTGPAGTSASQCESQTSSNPVKTNGADRVTVNSSGAVRVTSVTVLVLRNANSTPPSQFSTAASGGEDFGSAATELPRPETGGSKDMTWHNNRH